MKKKGALFAIIIILLAILLIVGIFSLLFSIKDIELNYTNSLSKTDKLKLESDINENLGKNVFGFSKKKFEAEIESNYPYVEIEHIEMVFPSKVIITLRERTPLFAINYNSKYYIFDKSSNLLDISSSNVGGDGDYSCVLVEGISKESLETLKSVEKAGGSPEVVKDKAVTMATEFFGVLNGLSFEYTDVQIKGFFVSVEADVDDNLLATTRYGTKLLIYDFSVNTEKKIANIMGAYTSGLASDPSSEIIIGNDLLPVLKKR